VHIGQTETLQRNCRAGFWNRRSPGHGEFSKFVSWQEPTAIVPEVR
jgi:hypothetical protein